MSKLSNTNNPKFSLEGRSLNSFCMSKVGQKKYKIFIGGYREGEHLLPFRTEKLSPLSPMILQQVCGKVGRRQLN